MIIKKYLWFYLSFGLFFVLYSSCAKGCGCGKKEGPETEQLQIQDLNFAGVVKDDEGNPVESAIVSVKIDFNGDNIFSPDETFSTVTNRNGFFFIDSKLITARLSQKQSEMLTGRMITGRIITGRIITGRIQVDVTKEGFAKNSLHLDGPGFRDIKLAKAAMQKDSNLKDGAQFSLVSVPGRAPILLADKDAKNSRIFAKQEGGEVIAEVSIPPELVSDYKEISGSVAFVNPASQPELMLGSFLAYKPDSEKGFITLSSAGFLSIQLQDEKGETISTFAPKIARLKGKQAEVKKPTLRMKIPEDVYHTLYDYVNETTDLVEVPMWYYDEIKGVWIQGEELGILQDENGNAIKPTELAKIVLGKETKKLYVYAKVEHFSSWNVDYPVSSHAAVVVQFVDSDGNPVSGLRISSQGNTYGGGDWGSSTDNNGIAGVDVKKSDPVHDNPSKGKMFGPYDDYLNGIPDKIPPDGDPGGGGVNCNDIINNYRSILSRDIEAMKDALFNLYLNGLIDGNTYTIHRNALSKASAALDVGSGNIKEDFKKALGYIKAVQKGLEPIGRASSDQIFYERWDEIGKEAKAQLVSFIVDGIYSGIWGPISKAVESGGVSKCGRAAIEAINEFVGLGAFKDFMSNAAAAIAKGEDPAEALAEQFTNPENIIQNIISKTAGLLTNEETLECLGSAVPAIGGILKGAAQTAFANLAFLAQTAGMFGAQAIQAWGEHREWKSAKAWETIQPYIDRFHKDFNAFLRAQNVVPIQCKDLFAPFFPFPMGPQPSAAPKAQLSYQVFSSPRVQPKQTSTSGTTTLDVYADDITTFFKMLSSFVDFVFKMDEIVKGGSSYFGERLWAVRCSFIQDKNYYVCSNSENPMDCSFSQEISKYVCTPKSNEKVQYVETSSSIIAYVQAPGIRVGGETRSKILINGQAFDLKTSLGFNLLDIPSPVESSSSYYKLYRWSREVKKPYLYIGKVILPIKKLKIKGKLVDEAKKPIPNELVCLWTSAQGKCISTFQDGTFSVSWQINFKAEKEITISAYGLSSLKVVSLPSDLSSGELDLGEIVLQIPVRITNFSIPASLKKNEKAKLSVSYTGGKNPKVLWKEGSYFSYSKDIGQGDSIDFTFKRSSYICVYVSDDFSSDSRCKFVQVITEKPSISIFAKGEELKEGVDYEFDEKTYVPFEIKVSDPDSPPEELRFSAWISDYKNNYSFSLSNIYSLSPILYTGRVNQDTVSYVNFSVCDGDWNCVQKKINIKVKNNPITPYVKIYPDKVSGHAPLKVGLRIDAKDFAGFISLDTNRDGKEDIKTYSNYVVVELKEQGDFKITAKVKSEDGIEASDSVNIKVFPEFKILSFSADKTQVRRKEVVKFEVSTSSPPLKYRWSFGDLSGTETTQNSVTHFYNPRFAGTFYPKVSVITDIGSEIVSQPIAIQVLNLPPRILSFSASATFGVAPFDVTLSVIAEDDFEVSKYVWVFGDGYKEETTSTSITHKYSVAGEYTASVTIYDSDGDTDTKTLRVVILAQPECDIPQVSLYANPTSGNAPLTVTFQATATSLFPISEYRWDFDGDGVIDKTTPSNTTQYTYYSSYSKQVTARVQVVNSCGNSNYADVQVQIYVARQYHSADYFNPISTCFPNDGTTFKFINDDRFKVADVNGDGIPDIVIISMPKQSFFVFYGNSGTLSGTFQFSASYSAITGHSIDFGFAIDDFDGDGKKDAVLSGGSGTEHYIYFYKNSGSSFSFSASSQINLAGGHCFPYDIQSADVNQDGKKDILVGCSGLSFFAYGNGNGTFSGTITFPEIQGWVRRAKFADLDKDGRLDIVGVNLDSLYFFVKLGTSAGFASAVTFTLPNSLTPASLDTADFDGDGKDEIVVISKDQILYLYKNNSTPGNLSFALQSTANAQIISPLNNISLEVEDMNSDGVPDIIWTASGYYGGATHFHLSFGDPTTISYSNGYPREVSSYHSGLPFNFGPIGLPDIEVSDVNQDGFTDVVLVYIDTNYPSTQFCIFSFIRKTTAPAPRFADSEKEGITNKIFSEFQDRASFSSKPIGCSVSQLAFVFYIFILFFLWGILRNSRNHKYKLK
jgi:PKD repeat protein